MFEHLPEFMTISQVAKALQLGRSTMYALTVEWEVTGGKSGMPFVWFGRQKRIPKAALIRFVNAALATQPVA
jgi:excisionase family DNA binding protein